MAELSSLSLRTIQRIENNEVEPTPYSLNQIGEVLGVNLHIAELKRLGASEDEIKTAVLIAADIMKMSTLFYGNEFDLEAFKKLLKGE